MSYNCYTPSKLKGNIMTTQTPLQIALVPLHNQLREAGKFLSAAQNTSATTPATLPQAQAQAATALTAASES